MFTIKVLWELSRLVKVCKNKTIIKHKQKRIFQQRYLHFYFFKKDRNKKHKNQNNLQYKVTIYLFKSKTNDIAYFVFSKKSFFNAFLKNYNFNNKDFLFDDFLNVANNFLEEKKILSKRPLTKKLSNFLQFCLKIQKN